MTYTDAALAPVTPGRAEAAGAGGPLAQPDLSRTGGQVGPELLQHGLLGGARHAVPLNQGRLGAFSQFICLPKARRSELAGELLRRVVLRTARN